MGLTPAVGDGVTDDTVALKDAFTHILDLTDIIEFDAAKSYIIFLPNGTYKVTDTITYHGPTRFADNWANTEEAFRLRFIGESRSDTIIKLPDGTSGFTDSNSPKTILQLARPDVEFNNANACNYIRNLTIDAGKNFGAVGIDMWGANNSGIQNVMVQAKWQSGHTGIHFRITIPAGYYQDIYVRDFKYGIHIEADAHSGQVRGRASHPVFEHVTCRNQYEAAIKIETCSVTIRDLYTLTSVPAVELGHDEAQLILLDSSLENGSSTNPAINITGTGHLFARNVSVAGYGSGVKQNGSVKQSGSISEYTNYAFETTRSSGGSLNLPIEDMPELFFDSDTNQWAKPSNTSSSAIQSAMDSGKSTVYFPEPAEYSPSSVTVPASVKCINGMFQKIDGKIIIDEYSSDPLFIIDTTHLDIDNQTSRTVVVLNSNWGYTENNNISSTWHLACTDQTDVSRLSNTTVYGRFINAEGIRHLVIDNNIWVQMGHKTERQSDPCIIVKGGAVAEILGATIGVSMSGPVLRVEDGSEVTFIGSNSADYGYGTAVEDDGYGTLSTSVFPDRRSERKFYTFQCTSDISLSSQIEAEDYNSQSGIQKVSDSSASGVYKVGYIQNGDWIHFNSIVFDDIDTFTADVATDTGGGTLEVRIDSATGTILGTISVSNTGGWSNWTTKSCSLNTATGTHDLYLKFTGGSGYLFDIDAFTLSK